jgi:hypothetical protein
VVEENKTREIEAILGLGKIDTTRKIPGTKNVPGREFRYVSCGTATNLGDLFEKLLRQVQPLIPQSGAAITENCELTLPSGERFFALSYRGELENWRKQVEQGAKILGLKVAKIVDDRFVVDDGQDIELGKCKVEFFQK